MSLDRKYSIYRKIAVFVAINMLVQIFAPTAAWALTGGPASPEFSSFEPVATTNMVSEFSGDLTYNLPVINIPGVNGGGYAMSLSYHSGTTPEEESSWVGYGWTLNPGAINRGKKGFPDDWKNEEVKYWNKTPANQTVALGGSIGNLELFSFNAPVSANSSIRYNNYKGFGYSIGAGISLAKGVVSLGYNISDGTGSFSLSLNPAAAMKGNKEKGKKGDRKTRAAAAKTARDKKNKAITKLKDARKNKQSSATEEQDKKDIGSRSALGGLGSGYGLHNFASAGRPTQIVDYEGISTTVSLNLLLAPSPLQAGITLGAFGSYTRQKNTEESDLNAYGYMYSANAGGQDMMDYFVEKGSTYTKQDKFLGVPYSNADSYTLTGEGLGGGFKLHNKESGTFHPNSLISVTNIFNVTPEVEVGLNYGGGGDIGVGHQELGVFGWETPANNGFSSATEDEDVFFRFANDMGGELSYDEGNTDAAKASVVYTGWIPGAKSATTNTGHIEKSLETNNNYSRSLRSSYIGYNTNKDLEDDVEGNVHYKAYAKGVSTHVSNGSIDRDVRDDQIGEFSIVNEDGARYNYGIPVLSMDEKNLQVDLNGLGSQDIDHRFLAYRNVEGSTETKVGEVRDAAYATSYLLTGITSPDYIDRSNNGPTDDDFGGYTKFSYDRVHGGSGSWYKWRMPYSGLSYSKNELSNPNDDLGSVAEGYKEMYYLDEVETKTHKAIFYKTNRRDGLDAEHSETTASTSRTAKGNLKLKKLEKIELYAKDPSGGTGKLIKTVHFEYDYSLCRNVKNYNSGSDSDNPNHNEGGKLTLKKVWFEYNGAVEAKISPYQFEYKYPTTADANYPARYDNLENYGSYSYGPNSEQNPDYSPFNIDAWGNYQYNGAPRFEDMRPWLDQSGTHTANFDPAAWQLKVIKLPSGGEIHAQYEQDDYCYVQDKQAHAMVRLKSGGSDSEFVIDTEDLKDGGLSLLEKQRLSAIITKEYIFGGKKMYFKILYKLIGNATPHITDCNAEYVTGYADVQNVEVNLSGELVVTLKDQGYSLPKDVCEDYVTTQRAGNLSFVGSNCDPSGGATIGGSSATSKVLGFLGQAATWVASLVPGTTCLAINNEYSYLKIPLLDAKKGGGVRVKRLLMFDKGIDSGKPVLYGSEYIYKTFDDKRQEYRSSGVATNEPGSIREENAMVGFMDRFSQSFWDKVVSGRDKKQSEGPIGESIMPGASVGYSKVTTKSIHSGKTNPGFAVKEFYTAKDYPVKMEMTEMERDNKDYLPLITGLVNKITNNAWVSQGYAFEVNSMHGQVKSTSTYAGDYSNVLNPNTSTLVSQEVMTYFQPGEELPILNTKDLSVSAPGQGLPLGKEMDMVFESKYVSDVNVDGNVEMDADAGIFGIVVFPFLSAFPSMTFSETELYSHTTSKVTSYPAVLKRTKSYADGIYHISENVAFNPETGKPIKVRTTDGYENLNLLASANHDGDYTKYTFPASMEYENVSQKAKNERKLVSTTTNVGINQVEIDNKLYLSFSALTAGANVCSAMSNFVGGDLIKLSSGGVFHTGDIAGSNIEIQPTNYSSVTSGNANSINVEIIRSGRTNQLNVAAGSLTTYGESSVVTTPIPSSIINLRQDFADILNTALNDTTTPDTIFPWDIPTGIEFVNADGSCSPLDSSCYILIEGNQVNIYGPGIPFNQDTVVVGTPGNPHPMVDSLNSYFSTYFNYELNPNSNVLYECPLNGSITYLTNNTPQLTWPTYLTQDISNTSPDVAAMRAAQQAHLNQPFADVNNGTHPIADYFYDEGNALGFTNTMTPLISPSSIGGTGLRLNKRVMLIDNLGKKHGYSITNDCTLNDKIVFLNAEFKPVDSVYVNKTKICSHVCDDETSEWSVTCGNDSIVIVNGPKFGENSNGYLTIKNHVEGEGNLTCLTDVRFTRLENGTSFPEIKCSSTIVYSGGLGYFAIDPKTAALVYYAEDNDCYAQDIPCLRFCTEHYPSTAITNVVASEANTLNDRWSYDESLYSSTGNDYEKGARGKWRTEHTYAFKTDVDRLSSIPTHDKTYNSGTYELELFNWENLNANGHKWLELNTVQQYSPNGNALEEENILGIKSAAKFGYHKTLPYLIAQNAAFNSIAFESFENNYSGRLEDGVIWDTSDGVIDPKESHSGKSSFKLKFPANDGVEMTEMTINNQILAKGLLFKTWIKTDFDDRAALDNLLKAEMVDVNNFQLISKSFKKVAQVGDWYLYEAKILPTDLVGMNVNDALKTFVKYEFTAHGSENVWIDDVRIQPMDAQATAYVYDVITHRLLTTFDDQHFGLFYQYNAEGKLVRKLIETERGMKTVQETQYNTPKIAR